LKHLPFLDLIYEDIERVEALLRERPPDQHEAIGVAVDQLVGGGGKRIRPALVLLSSHLCKADIDKAIFAAAAAEMLHTATLIHDDLIDGALMRRGIQTLSARWSHGATVLTGDYIFARSAYLASRCGDIRLMQCLTETLMVICNGEILQMFNGQRGRNFETSVSSVESLSRAASRQEYEQRIYAKTASLIAMSAQTGAILADAEREKTDALRAYGERLGMAFQIVDDVLDFVADDEVLGKPVGGDLRQGLVTLPLLLFLEAEPDHPAVRRALEENPSDEVAREAVRAVAGSSSIEQALEVARQHVDQAKAALSVFSDSSYLTALLDMADFIVRRYF